MNWLRCITLGVKIAHTHFRLAFLIEFFLNVAGKLPFRNVTEIRLLFKTGFALWSAQVQRRKSSLRNESKSVHSFRKVKRCVPREFNIGGLWVTDGVQMQQHAVIAYDGQYAIMCYFCIILLFDDNIIMESRWSEGFAFWWGSDEIWKFIQHLVLKKFKWIL